MLGPLGIENDFLPVRAFDLRDWNDANCAIHKLDVLGAFDLEPKFGRELASKLVERRGLARELVLFVLAKWRSLLPAFADDVSTANKTWEAVVRFGKKNNTFVEEVDARFRKVFADLAPAEQRALDQAMKDLFGA